MIYERNDEILAKMVAYRSYSKWLQDLNGHESLGRHLLAAVANLSYS